MLRAQSVTIFTDQEDYSPGESVVITGTGWTPGDNVQLSITHIGDYIPDHTHTPWTLVADVNGNLYDEWYVAEMELNTTMWLQAQSLSIPGMYAEKVFTDGLHTWTGAISTNWNIDGNWSPSSVPTIDDDVTIPSAPTNQPVINTGSVSFAKKITIAVDATLTINGGTLTTADNWTVNGTYTQSGGTVTLTGGPTSITGTFTLSEGTYTNSTLPN